ncbi:hypothetical protein RB195_002909 [Necator americanus]|uniref:Reverse transcriptase domain-containing protein n=1 Tax=Necator americanus TaxID=51031 RepID=A0ABR1DMP3_NECAM
MIKICQEYSKPVQLEFLDFEDAFDSSHQSRLLNALRADGVPAKVCHNEDLFAEIDVVCRRITHLKEKYQHLAPPSKVAAENRLRLFGDVLRRPEDRVVQRFVRILSSSR